MQCCMFRHSSGCIKAVIILLLILVIVTGCSAPEREAGLPQASPAMTGTPAPAAETPSAVQVQDTMPATPEITTVTQPAATTNATPVPPPSGLPESAINARIVDARNKLSNLIDSNVADTVILYPGSEPGCEMKKSRELGYLIDSSTGESTFVIGDYWSIDTALFTDYMKKDSRYIIIHTHPKVWVTCEGSGIISFNTFSLEDLEVTANLTRRGYHVRELIAIADRDYRIWPGQEDGWRSRAEILLAVHGRLRPAPAGSSRITAPCRTALFTIWTT